MDLDSDIVNTDDETKDSDVEEDESDEEIEIDITDRAAQTIVNMRDKNFSLIGAKSAGDCVEKEAQTEVMESEYAERSGNKLSNSKLEEIDDSLLNLFIENLLPYDFVENEPFRMFAKVLEPKYHFPKRKKLVTKVGMLYNTVKDELKEELAKTHSVVITHNSWLSMEQDMYDMAIVHFVSDKWKLRHAALRTCLVSQNPRSSAEFLEETRVKWNLPEPICVANDSEFEAKVGELLEWKRMPCFGSCIHDVIRQCMSKADVYRFLNQGRRLVSQVNNNPQVVKLLEKKKMLLLPEDIQKKSLVLDDGEKWSSLLEMIVVLSEQTPALHAAIMDPDIIGQNVDLRNHLYAFSEQSVLETLVKILTSFRTATEILTKSGEPTLQKVVPTFVKLDKCLEEDTDDSAMVKEIKVSLHDSIAQYLEPCRDMCLLACLVHPQTKQMAFVSAKEKEQVRNLLYTEVKEQCENEQKGQNEEERKFKKGKKPGGTRQTKSMSEVVDNADVRRIVVSSEDGNQTRDDVESGGSDEEEGEVDEGMKVDVGEVDDSDNGCQDGDCDVGPTGDINGRQGKARPRNVRRTESGELSQITLSITVENDWLDDVIGGKDDQKSPEETAKIEVNLYMAEPSSSKNPLVWWKEKSALFPHIGKIARKVLAIPASSVSAEEVFRLKRNLEKRQIQVKTEHLDMMLFLKENKNLCDME